jgi:hypothetical protein
MRHLWSQQKQETEEQETATTTSLWRGELLAKDVSPSRGRIVPQLPNGQQPILQDVAKLLDERNYSEAARYLLDRQREGALPADDALVESILNTLGTERAAKLVSGFVHYPCPSCRNGLERCARCSGHGFTPDDPVCETCAGSGMVRCDFCGGSGLATYNIVPSPLRYPVLARRVNIVSRQVKAFEKLPVVMQEVPLLQNLLNLNKLQSMLENALTVAEHIASYDPRVGASVEELVELSQTTALQIDVHVRNTLRQLATFWGGVPEDSPHGSIAIRKANFYRDLSTSTNFQETSLCHPFVEALRAESSNEAA